LNNQKIFFMAVITTTEYAKKRGTSTVAVTRAINKGRKLIGIKSYRKVGRDWLLTECNDVAKKNIKKGLVIQK